ncbi:hypothetical protein BDA96_05G059700 [Sorghum bicolor]|uniref:Knottin scorpion toxin-like domain-containing protein n=2 Tax=Sorghum bicolor TaxID=4558 RepID=A0A921QW62_SORBI|nr:hypothetical protein BDA96_05G059700 [Sorghum bicolor]OQU82990.1 hypothetical protein SORBI_3005G058350 [Sorghum bicolor]
MAASFSSVVCRILVVVALIVTTLSSYGAANSVCIQACWRLYPYCNDWCKNAGFIKGGSCNTGKDGNCCCWT